MTTIDDLPHRPPFRFVTRLQETREGRSAQGEWRLAGDEDFFQGHFPGEPVVPGVLLAEALAQLSGLIGPAQGGTRVRLAHVDVKFPASASPPVAISLNSVLRRTLGELRMFDVTAADQSGRIVAHGSLTLSGESRA